MVRMSALPAAKYCGMAAELSAQHGAGRPAAMSRAHHASCADAPEAKRLFMALSPHERDEVKCWQKPTPIIVNDSVVLDYPSSVKEIEVGLDVFGEFVDTKEEALTWGHLDFAWVREIPFGDRTLRIAYVADIKKSVWTTAEGPDSLQLHAYGRAFAKKMGCDGYCTGIWAAVEGEWMWSMDIVMLDGPAASAMWTEIAYAASNKGEYAFGDHCRSCFARMHCPEWTVAPEHAMTALAPFAGDRSLITSEVANKLLLEAKRAKETAEYVTGEIQEMVRRGMLEVYDQDGKKYGPVPCKGRERVDLDMAREKAPELITRGAPYEQFRFLKVRAR